jgi:Protein of unknown function (DUF1566)
MKRQAGIDMIAPLLLLLLAAAGAPERYRDQEDGTVKDTRSGLVWLADAACLGSMPWARAKAEVAALQDGDCGLTDGSRPGDWRLPSKAEWVAMVDCSCGEVALGDDLGTACYAGGASSFRGVQPTDYWSSTESIHDGTVRVMSLTLGLDSGAPATASLPVWPVRD